MHGDTFLVVGRTYGLDEAGALLTRIRVALTEWDSGYEEACEAAMAFLWNHQYLPTLFTIFLTSKVLCVISMLLSVSTSFQVCPYDYERIQFVLLHLERDHYHHKVATVCLYPPRLAKKIFYMQQMQLLLSLLVTHTRCCLPTTEERVWHSSHCHSVCRAVSVSVPLIPPCCVATADCHSRGQDGLTPLLSDCLYTCC